MTLVVVVWCALTAYISYRVQSILAEQLRLKQIPAAQQGATESERIFAWSCLAIGCIFIVLFGAYAYNRESQDPFAESSLILGFRWYDAAILFVLVVWCAMSIAIGSILIREYDNEQAKGAKSKVEVTDTDRNVSISVIVFAIVVLVQYISYLVVQERLPSWCREYSKLQEQQRQLIEELSGKSRSKEATATPQTQIVLLPGGTVATQEAKRPVYEEFL